MKAAKLKILLTLCFGIALCVTTSITAQENSGTVQGKVTDGSTGDIMRSVTVELLTKEKQSTKKGAYSDVTGKYTIKKVQQGVYSLRFRYVGFESKLIENVEVAAGKTVTVNVTLSPETKKSTEVVVTARANKESKEAILAQRKNSAQVSDGVSKEEISRLPDADAGQALKRVSGVTLVGDKFIYVRGSSDRYSNTTLNGSTLTSTEPDKRSFDFGMFPSEFLQQANITKSFTPDLPGNFAGGLVQLQTIDFPDGFSVKASLSTSGNNNTQIGDNIFSSYQGGSDDWLARDDGTRSMSSATPGSREDINRLLLNARRQDAQGDSARTTLQNFARGFNQNVWTNNNFSANPNTSFALSFSNLYDVFDNDLGVIASVNYGNPYAINSIVRSPILADKEFRQENAGSVSTRSVNYGGMANIAYKLGGHSSLSFKNVFNRSADDETTLLQGRDIPQGIDIRPSSWQFVQKELFSTQVNGEHTVPFDSTAIISSLLFDWRLGYSQSLRDEPDFRRLRYSRQSVDSTLPFTADIQPTPQGDGTLAGRFYSSLNDFARNAAFNIALPVYRDTKFKTGFLTENKNRYFSARSFTINQPTSGADFDIDFSDTPDSLFRAENFRQGGLGMSEDSKRSDSYIAGEELYAGYFMIDAPFSIAGEQFRIIGGARVEDAVQSLNSFDTEGNPINITYATTDWLPSFNLIYKATEAMNVRMSATRTLTRPNLREFAPFAFYDFQSLFVVRGNPNLERTLISNYDIRYEYFPQPGEVFSVSVFYKNFINPIEETIDQVSSEYIRTFSNGQSVDSTGKKIADGNAFNYGVEFEARKSLAFLGDYFRNFGINANVSLIQSEITVLQGRTEDKRSIWGQSPYSLNIGLFFTEPDLGTSVNIGYNRYGRRIVQVGLRGAFAFDDPHVYEQPRDVIDISIIQPLLDNAFEVKLVARDILNQELLWQQGGKTIASNLRGTTFSIGMSYRFR